MAPDKSQRKSAKGKKKNPGSKVNKSANKIDPTVGKMVQPVSQVKASVQRDPKSATKDNEMVQRNNKPSISDHEVFDEDSLTEDHEEDSDGGYVKIPEDGENLVCETVEIEREDGWIEFQKV